MQEQPGTRISQLLTPSTIDNPKDTMPDHNAGVIYLVPNPFEDVDIGTPQNKRTIGSKTSIIKNTHKQLTGDLLLRLNRFAKNNLAFPASLSASQTKGSISEGYTNKHGGTTMSCKMLALSILCSAVMAKNITRIIAPPRAMATTGVPIITSDPRAERLVGLYLSTSRVDLLDWTRRSMLISANSSKNKPGQVFELESPMGKLKQKTFFDNVAGSASWSPTRSDGFVLRKDTDGDEKFQLFWFDHNNHHPSRITDGMSRNGFPVWNPTGDKIAFASIQKDGNTAIYTAQPDTPSSLRLVSKINGSDWDEVDDWSPDGKFLLMVKGDPIEGPCHIMLIDASNGDQLDITPSVRGAVYVPIGFTPDSRGIIVVTTLDSEFRRLAYLDLKTKAVSFLSSDKWDLDAYLLGDYERPALSRDRKWLAFSVNEDGLSTLHLLDVVRQKVVSLPTPQVGTIRNLRWNGKNDEFAFNMNSNRSPGDIYSINIKTGKTTQWSKASVPGLNIDQNASPELIKWKSFDQKEISGWLYRPPSKFKGKRPVIVDIHGGPDFQFRPDFLAEKNYFINELGVAMIFPNVRGSSGYGKTFLKLDDVFNRESSYKDIESLLDWIITAPGLDADKIMIEGHSYGGHMAYALAARVGDRVACFSASAGMPDLGDMLRAEALSTNPLPELGASNIVEYGNINDASVSAFLDRISPLKHATSIKRPMLVLHGKNDPRSLVAEVDRMVDAVRANGTPVWYLRPENEGHHFTRKDNVRYSLLVTIQFINTFLTQAVKKQ